jgi:voltage-gated potassium channel
MDSSNRFTRALEAAVLVGALATIPLTLLGEEDPAAKWVKVADWSVWAVFLLEYVVMVVVGPERSRYVRRNPLNLAVIVISYPHLPAIFGLVRLARLSRFLRLLRLMSVTARAIEALRMIVLRRGVVLVTGISLLIIFAGGASLTLLEPATVKGGFGDGVWWAIVTASTVGYGDIAPTTLIGRLIAVLLMLSGVGLISTLAASITAYFIGTEETVGLREMGERLARIESMLDALIAARVAVLQVPHREATPAATGTADASLRRANDKATEDQVEANKCASIVL